MIAVPKALDVPRALVIDLDVKPTGSKKSTKKVLKRNPLFTVTDLESVPQSKRKGFLVNGLFGNENNESIAQVLLQTTKPRTRAFMRKLPLRLREGDCAPGLR